MGAAWRDVKDGPEFDRVLDMVREVKALGSRPASPWACSKPTRRAKLKDNGPRLLQPQPRHRPQPLRRSSIDHAHLRRAARHPEAPCASAGDERCAAAGSSAWASPCRRGPSCWHELAGLEPQPESVPINALVAVEGTPLENEASRWTGPRSCAAVAAARLLMPHTTVIRLSAGRTEMDRGGPGPVLPGRRQLDLRGRRAAHHPQPRAPNERRRAVRQAGPRGGSSRPS